MKNSIESSRKTYKSGNQLRPIISHIPTTTYTPAKSLDNTLTPHEYVPSDYTIIWVIELIEILRDVPKEDNDFMP